MIDFEKELNAILANDPLGLLKEKPKTSSVMSADSRLQASFEQINQFIDTQGHEPQKSRDISERRLFSRLQWIRDQPEKAASLLDADRHHLLDRLVASEPVVIESIEDILEADPLGLLGNSEPDAVDIFDLKNLPSSKRASTDFVAKRKPCNDFERYEAQLIQVQTDLKKGQRKLISFTDKGEALVEGNYYILGGILLYLEKTNITSPEKTIKGKRFRKDGRTRCVFENRTESNMLYRSLAKALYQGGKIVTQTESQIERKFQQNLGSVKENDKRSGCIYILKSLSKKPDIQPLVDLYKIGFSTTSVEKRIANAENEPTYLMSPVTIMAEYETYNMKTQTFETLIHHFFSAVCVDLKVTDNQGKIHYPREWFIAPYAIINQAISLIENEQIVHYCYDAQQKEIVPI